MQKLGLGNINHTDRCIKYFPRYLKQDFLQELQYTNGQIIQYLPQKIKQIKKDFQTYGLIIKAVFWAIDLPLVIFCHKIKFLSRLLGQKSWKMFIFKICLLGLPLQLIDTIDKQAKEIYQQQLYNDIKKSYRRYKRTGDILDLSNQIILQQKETQIQKILKVNQFTLLHEQLKV